MYKLIPLSLLALVFSGCTHSLKITNKDRFEPASASIEQPVAIGFAPVGNDRLLIAAIREMKRSPLVKDSKEDYKPAAEFKADYVCTLTASNHYRAHGQNFLITFPGFIVFTHAMIGYKYSADIDTHSVITDGLGNVVSKTNFVNSVDFRHCSFARGAAAGCCGWLAPGYGAAAIIPGIIFTASYDKRATEEFVSAAEPVYGPYIAAAVLQQISRAKGQPVTNAAASTAVTVPDEVMLDAAPGQFAVSVWAVESGRAELKEQVVRELPPHARGILANMTETRRMPNRADLETVLDALGMSAGEYAGALEKAEVSTRQGAEWIGLSR